MTLVLILAASLLPGETVRGAALLSTTQPAVLSWGRTLRLWPSGGGASRILARADFDEGGCVTDVDGDGHLDLVVQEGRGLGRLTWRSARNWTRARLIDTGVEMTDCLPAAIHRRRGVLVVHRGAQVRFYEIPPDPSLRWPYREIYSFYTPSKQSGMLLADVDGDGRPDILCGNYWIRSPESFDLPWRLFAINTWSEEPLSAISASGMDAGGRLWVAQREMAPARLAWFTKPPDPKQLWVEQRVTVEPPLRRPRALAIGRGVVFVGEDHGRESRILMFQDYETKPTVIRTGVAVHHLWMMGDGLVAAGPEGVFWWLDLSGRNTSQSR